MSIQCLAEVEADDDSAKGRPRPPGAKSHQRGYNAIQMSISGAGDPETGQTV